MCEIIWPEMPPTKLGQGFLNGKLNVAKRTILKRFNFVILLIELGSNICRLFKFVFIIHLVADKTSI